MKEKKKSKKWLIPQVAQHWTAIPRVPSSYLVGFRALFFVCYPLKMRLSM